MKKTNVKKLTTMAMLAAVAYLAMLLCHLKLVPEAGFLTYDPKDVILCVVAFLMGPLSGVIVTVLVGLIEMVTVSDSGIIGLIMNVLSSLAFVLPASLIYKKNKKMSGAIIGLSVGVITATITMLLWNYLVTPIYMGVPRATVQSMLLPVFLPFNLLKAAINMGLTLVIYKPLVKTLRKTGLVEENENPEASKGNKWLSLIVGCVILLICVVVYLILQ